MTPDFPRPARLAAQRRAFARPALRTVAARASRDAAPGVRHVRAFAATADQVGQARRFLAGLAGDSDEARDAVTCLSELATNACLHSASARPGGTFTVRVIISDNSDLRIEVSDQGGPWRRAEHDDTRPHGLAIVAALARDVGITGSQTSGWTAWATFPRPAPSADHPTARCCTRASTPARARNRSRHAARRTPEGRNP